MEEWWDKLVELIARQLAHRWRSHCGGPKPPLPIQEEDSEPRPRSKNIDAKREKGKTRIHKQKEDLNQ